MTNNGRMVTPEQLAAMLREVNVADVAKAADVSTKTVYRIRQNPQKYSPTLQTAARLIDAVKALKAKPAKRAKVAA